ncbi:50S ribosomal protein L3 [Helicobacter sp. MIT 14-3879]|uniref:50S ribosomal protein L3 n=1 Tax=Helicobacter sp. MIT 14-3879 TaxID=2040649 RepID=UPI000E1F3102|nr:50S ribosomal protein L3 [Helicobacter sp. MIT 14-3879]RDU64116.1 50S ribosomal protein L3 [Helicobacter sp. MIT 14-3879]
MEFLVEKIGMSRTIGNKSEAVTLLKIIDTKVCELLDSSRAIVAYKKGKFINKPILGQQKKYNITKEFNKFSTLLVNNKEIGNLDLSILESAKRVKVSMKTKGRGFSGVMKRWNFQGGPAAHGSRFHRAPGSIGNREWPGRVQKGKKMSGHYGNEMVTTQNEILSFDKDNSILILKGSVPGYNGIFGRIKVIK